MRGSRKLYVKSFGCQMNVYDSRRMADTLAPLGYAETATADEADLIILNTCHIREKAAEKVYSELGRVRRMKEAAAVEGRALYAIIGATVQQYLLACIGDQAGLVVAEDLHWVTGDAEIMLQRDGSNPRYGEPSGRRQERAWPRRQALKAGGRERRSP